jgi:uncharacterized protein YdhG (YjbR/CyaY superfamily)
MTKAKQFRTISEYARSFPKPIASRLRTIAKIVSTLAPDAEPIISYGMPAFRLGKILVYFAAFERHIGLYAMPGVVKVMRRELAPFKTTTGGIQFAHDTALPVALIRKIISYRLSELVRAGKPPVCSRGHAFTKSRATPTCPKCWPGRYSKKR